MKRGVLAPSILVGLVLSTLGVVGLTIIFGNIILAGDSLPKEVYECQQSAFTAAQIADSLPAYKSVLSRFGFKFAQIPYVCPTTDFNITMKDLNKRLSSADSKLYAELEYTSKEEYNLDLLMWRQLNYCYQKMFYGDHPLFARNLINQDGTSTMCVVCGIIDFDEEVQQKYGDVRKKQIFELVKNRDVTGNDPQTLYDKANNHPTVAKGLIFPNYKTSKRQAALYVRTNAPYLGNAFLAAVEEAELSVDALTSMINNYAGTDIGETHSSSFRYEDIETLMFIDYDSPEFIEQNCQEVVADLGEAK